MKQLKVQSWHAYELAMKSATCRVALDIGANDGGYTATLRENGFSVLAFEPVPKMFEQLYRRHSQDEGVTCASVALSDKEEVIENCRVMHAWTLGDPAKVGMSISPDHKDDRPFRMFCDTLDNQMQIHGVRKIGIIKLDVDGYEFRVLRGGEKTIRRDMPPILCEFGEYVERLGESNEEMVNFIFSMGYKIVSMDAKHEFNFWEEVKFMWPEMGTFDVMLFPR